MNIFGYLKWRGDVPLGKAPFNEADNLILSELAYTDFGGIVPEDGTPVSLAEACDRFFQTHTREEILASKSYTARAPLLMEEMRRGARFADTRLAFYQSCRDREAEMQFGAVTFLLPDGSAFAAFRGTDGTLLGWKEDFRLSYLSGTEGQKRSALYLDRIAEGFRGPIKAGGHSKGGNLAMYAAAFCSPETQKKLVIVYNNDGPGFRPEVLQEPGYQRVLPRILSIVPETSVIGMMMETGSERHVVRSTASGIVQHDGFSWETEPDGLEDASLSDASVVIRQMLEGWLDMTDDEARKSLTDTVFTLLESTGEETFSGINESRWKSFNTMASFIRKLPKGSMLEVGKLISRLGQSGVQAASSYLSGKTAGKVQEMTRLPKRRSGEKEKQDGEIPEEETGENGDGSI